MEYDIDNDYDIDPTERETVVNNALQVANNANNQDKDKKQQTSSGPSTGQNVQPTNPPVAGK